jgi:hypothetical protein
LDHDRVKEIYTANENEMGYLKAAVEDTDFRFCFKADIFNMIHARAIKYNLNQNLASLMPEIVDELDAGMHDEFDSVVTNGVFFVSVRG